MSLKACPFTFFTVFSRNKSHLSFANSLDSDWMLIRPALFVDVTSINGLNLVYINEKKRKAMIAISFREVNKIVGFIVGNFV